MKIFAGIIKAYEMVVEINLPISKNLRDEIEKISDYEEILPFTLMGFPFVGLLIGLSIYFTVKIFSFLLGILLTTVLFAPLIALFLELSTHSKGVKLTTMFFYRIIANKVSMNRALLDLSETDSEHISEIISSGFVLIFLFRALIIGLLIYKCKTIWIVPVLCLQYTLQGTLGLSENSEGSSPLIKNYTLKNPFYYLWGPAIVISMLFSPHSFIYGLAGCLFAYVFANTLSGYCERELQGVSSSVVTMAGYICETVLLLIGMG